MNDAQKFVIVLHYYATGPGQEIHDWLRRRQVAETLLIEHPFPFCSRNYARIERVIHGSCFSEHKVRRRRWFMPLRYMLDALRTIRVVWRTGEIYDIYVGNGSFDTLAGIALRSLGRVRHVVLYTIDYSPTAHGSRFYRAAYRMIDRFCCYHADVIWNLARRMQVARIEDGLQDASAANVIHVPHGTHSRALRSRRQCRAWPHRAAFLGHILEKSGLQLFIDAMPRIRERVPDLTLEIVGDGPFRKELEQQVRENGLEDAVTFHGFMARHDDIESLLMTCGLGLALYWPERDDYSKYADPGKPKVYLACGLPVVIVDVPEVAQEIGRRGAGVVIRYDRTELEDAVLKIIGDHDTFRDAAIAMGEDYDWDLVFDKALKDSNAAIKEDARRGKNDFRERRRHWCVKHSK